MKCKGFTLMEILVVIAIIAILAGVALPSYQSYLQKGYRVEAQLALTKIAQQFERVSARQGQYPTGSEAAAIKDAMDTPASYTFAVSAAVDTFTISATPDVGEVNETDQCGTLSIDQTGQTQASGAGDCW